MPRNLNDIMNELSPARRKKVEARAAQLIAEQMTRQDPSPRPQETTEKIEAEIRHTPVVSRAPEAALSTTS
jgi:hypothetical protein